MNKTFFSSAFLYFLSLLFKLNNNVKTSDNIFWTIVFFPKEVLLIIFARQVCWQQICLSEKVIILLSSWRIIVLGLEVQHDNFFYHLLNISLHSFLDCMVSNHISSEIQSGLCILNPRSLSNWYFELISLILCAVFLASSWCLWEDVLFWAVWKVEEPDTFWLIRKSSLLNIAS